MNPYFIQGPALISFSGGRTSAFMLFKILEAHGGKLPDDVIVVFANTGKEDEKTLRFVYECGARWNVKVSWLERVDGGYQEVGFNSAARLGEPFEALIKSKGFVPNRGAPFCSIELKGRVIRDFINDTMGWKHWNNVIGLRYDEGLRVLGAMKRNMSKKERWTSLMPMAEAKHVKRNVLEFWLGKNYTVADMVSDHPESLPQGFDLGLFDYTGNCNLCWKKSLTKRKLIIRDDPSSADWWISQEQMPDRLGVGGSLFDEKISISDLRDQVLRSPDLFDDEPDDEGGADEECGINCTIEDGE